jgi:PAS domain S-box-containing protein
MFGYSRAELLGEPLEILLPDRIRRGHVAHRTGYFAEPRIRPMGIGLDLSGRRKDGTEFPAEISLSHVKSAEGGVAIAFITDITERQRVETQLQRQREVSIRTRSWPPSAPWPRIAHEMNNPPRHHHRVRSCCWMPSSRRSRPGAGRPTGVHRASQRVARIAASLRSFARVPSDRALDLNTVVDGASAARSRWRRTTSDRHQPRPRCRRSRRYNRSIRS